MPLISTPYQPFAFNPIRPTDCPCVEGDYNFMIQPGDQLYWQGRQTPCGNNEICDGNFTSLTDTTEAITDTQFNDLSPEELINGTFTGNADSWVIPVGSGWSYNVDNVIHAAGTAGQIAQFLNTPTVINAVYKVVFTISGRTAGTITGGFIDGLYSAFGATISSNGTFTQYIKTEQACFTFGFGASVAFDGILDSVSVRRVAETWVFPVDDQEGWSINSNGFAHTITSGAYGDTPFSLRTVGNIPNDTDYNVTIEIEDGSGTVYFVVGNGVSIFYTLTGGAQTITFTINSGTGGLLDFVVQPGTASQMIISEISAEEIAGECWDFETSEWIIGLNSLCHVPGNASVLAQIPTTLPGYWQLKFTIAGRTAGTIGTVIASAFGSVNPVSENKNYVQYFNTASPGQLEFFTSIDFDGCISAVELYELRRDFPFELRDLDGNMIADLIGYSHYDEDFVTLSFDPADVVQDGHPEKIVYGCYRIWTYDNCEVQFEEIIRDGAFLNPLNIYWVVGDFGGCTVVITGNQLVITKVGVGDTFVSIQNNANAFPNSPDTPLTIPAGFHNYRVTFDVIANDDATNINAAVLGGYQIGAYASPSTVGTHTNDFAYDPEYTSPARHWFSLLIRYIGTSGQIILDNISVRRIEPFDATYISPVIKYAESFKCTSYVQAYATEDQMGFKFFVNAPPPSSAMNARFKLGHRIRCKAINPTYPEDTNDYLYSSGLVTRNFGRSRKRWNLLIGLSPEYTHDAIRLQRILQYFEIQNTFDVSFQTYFPEPGDYIPKWIKSAEYDLAGAEFEIVLQDFATGTGNFNDKFFRNT